MTSEDFQMHTISIITMVSLVYKIPLLARALGLKGGPLGQARATIGCIQDTIYTQTVFVARAAVCC